MSTFPAWLHGLSATMLLVGLACSAAILVDVVRNPQKMAVMNVVWPVTALFGMFLTVWAYRRYGRTAGDDSRGAHSPDPPFPVIVAKGALHCGSGCMLGDILAEWTAFLVPGVAAWFGWHTLFDDRIYAVWVFDFVLAFLLGIVFQYFAIAPMRNLSFWRGVRAALKADTLSLSAWQIGMYGFMAFAQFRVFSELVGTRPGVDTPEFWFAMQIAMLAGFVTAYPVNWWLIRAGIKEKM